MAPGRLTRFLNLEKPRTPGSGGEPSEVVNKARFDPPSPQEIPLAMDFGEQPFLRCPSCEADNNRVAERCFNCQRSLQGEDVRAWNAAFWQKRKAEESAPEQPATERKRLLGEALAASVGEREKARLWWWKTDAERPDSTPAGMKLLALIRDDNRRIAAALGMAVTFLLSAWTALAATNHPGLRVCAGVVAALLFTLFIPNTRRGPRWWDSN